ncbi:MAG TPA: pyridoxamine 5'-phosphate oxidase family protein [Acidothermaceae bacterium]|nr:pyridoxamine 5'-phosphate oxidase family protein [Acidothermaceae bacterium]
MPEFAARVQALFDARKHKTMATLRRDGSPRISGIEMQFVAGRVTFGMMDRSMKALDVQRDPRVAFHSPSVDPPEADNSAWVGEAKLSGRAVPWSGDQRGGEHGGDGGDGSGGGDGGGGYEVDIDEVALTYLGDGQLVIESWHPGLGHRRRTRD